MYGHEHVALLNGGFSAWQAHGFEVSDKVPDVKVSWSMHCLHISIIDIFSNKAIGKHRNFIPKW
jgi:hypothetical protein